MTNRRKELLRSLKFLLFSVSAGLIQIGTFTLLNELAHLDYWQSLAHTGRRNGWSRPVLLRKQPWR